MAILGVRIFLSLLFVSTVMCADNKQSVSVEARIKEKQTILSTSVLTRNDIDSTGAQTLSDLLQAQAGLEVLRYGPPWALSSILIRGQNANAVVLFINGIRVPVDSLGLPRMIDIPISMIEKIEINRGNLSAIYGESAVGGVIQVFTYADSVKPKLTASASYGSRNTLGLSLGYAIANDKDHFTVAADRYSSDGYSAMSPQKNLRVNSDQDGATVTTVFLDGEKYITKDWAVGFLASLIDGKIKYDDGSSFTPVDINTTLHHSLQDLSDLTLYSKFHFTPIWSSRLSVTQSQFKRREFEDNSPNGGFESKQLSTRWDHKYHIGHGDASFGGESVHAVFENPTQYTRNSIGYYTGYDGQFNKLSYRANLRHDQIKAINNTTIKKSATSWLGGLGYSVTDKLQIIGSASSSFRAPNTAEIFDVPEWWTTGNPNLEPEVSRGYELGWRYDSFLGRLKLQYFTSSTKNAIIYDAGTYLNIGKTKNNGIELNLSGDMQGWYYTFASTYQNPRQVEDGSRLMRRARSYGSVVLSKSLLDVDWGAQVMFSANRLESSQVLPGYAVVNLMATKKLTNDFSARLTIENAFNKSYELVGGYSASPFGLFFSLTYNPI